MMTRLLAAVLWSVTLPAGAQPLSTYTEDFLSATFNVETLWEPAASAAWSNYITRPAGFGSGANGYAYHLGVALADNVNGKFMRDFAFAAVSGHPEEYAPLGGGPVLQRVWHAIRYTVVKPAGGSSNVFNWSGLPASFASAGLSNAYQPPEQRTWLDTIERAAIGTAGYVAGNIWLEFTKNRLQPRARVRKILKSN